LNKIVLVSNEYGSYVNEDDATHSVHGVRYSDMSDAVAANDAHFRVYLRTLVDDMRGDLDMLATFVGSGSLREPRLSAAVAKAAAASRVRCTRATCW
jgi:hypothetical protein